MKKSLEEITKDIFDNKILFWSCFGIIILLALGLRLTLINFPLWYDEGCSIAGAINTFPQGINNYLWTHDLQHTPLYFYILHFIMNLFGDSVVVLRISSLLVSMAILPVTYIVTEKLSSKKVALAAMLLMSINTFQVLYSIEIRMYPYVILLALLSINYLIDYDRNGDKSSLIKLGIVNVLNPYFLTGSIVFVIAQFIIYTSYMDLKKSDEKKIQDYVVSNLIVLLCYIPYFVLIGHYAIVRSHFLVTDLTQFSAINFWGMLQNMVGADAGHIHETRFEPFANDWKSLVLVFIPIIGLITGLLSSLTDKEKLNSVIMGIVTLSFVTFVLLANARVIAFTGRYLIFITPFLFILMAIGFSKFNKWIIIASLLFYTSACIYGFKITYHQYRNIAEFSLKSPADYVQKNYPGKDNLVIMPFASSVSFYYFKGDDMPRVMPLELFHSVRNPKNNDIYDKEQQEAFLHKDKYLVFQDIIIGNKYISKNFVEFIDGYLKSVPKGGYIIWVVYYSDNYALIPPNAVKQIYSNIENVKAHTMTGMLSKFDIDLIAMLSQRADYVGKSRDASNQFFVFRRK